MSFNIVFIVFLSMIFCHIVDDYYLQGILASMKQRDWWKNYPKMYEKDYLVALFMHGFSWSFMVHIPVIVWTFIFGSESNFITIGITCIFHAYIHALIDDLKANKKVINLIVDQLIHIIQIISIFTVTVIFS